MSGPELTGRPHGAAAPEERAELRELRDEANRTPAAAAQTLTELADRLSLARRPGVLARRLTADARNTAVRRLRGTARRTGARRALLAATAPALAVVVAVVLARQRART